MKTLLFLCSGNYYRSRYAEMLFNHIARRDGLAWRADSRGLKADEGNRNVGPISVFTLARLKACGIPVETPPRYPKQVCEDDFLRADLTIAMKEAEHRAIMARRYPAWENAIEYWNIHDLDCAGVEEALGQLHAAIEALSRRIV